MPWVVGGTSSPRTRDNGPVREPPEFDIERFLQGCGLSDAAIAAAGAEGTLLLVALDQLIFPGTPRFDQRELLERAGIDHEDGLALWGAMGFAAAPDDAVIFFQEDLDALSLLAGEGPLASLLPAVVRQTRVVSAAMARIAEQSTDQLVAQIRAMREGGVSEDGTAQLLIDSLDVPRYEQFLWYMFKRQFRAAAWRRLADPAQAGGRSPAVVGFVDLVRFAALTEKVAEDELDRLITRFEDVAFTAIADAGARVVKTIGDEVMFVADDPEAATLMAVDLVDAYATDDLLPPARAGLALGPVLARDGDMLTLKWRDYPQEPNAIRHASAVALLKPNPVSA